MNEVIKQGAATASLGWVLGWTTLGFIVAFGFWTWWAWSSRNRERWEADSRLPLNDGGDS